MNNVPQRKALARICALLLSCQMTIVLAAESTIVEVKQNDTLSGIVVQTYPGAGNRRAIMQVILEKNPDAFVSNDINRLIVGRKLSLPNVADLPIAAAVQRSAATGITTTQSQQIQNNANTATLAQIQALTAERDRLSTALEQLESENRVLQTRLTELEQLKKQQDEQLSQLDQKISELEAALAASRENNLNAPDQAAFKQLQSTNDAAQVELEQLKAGTEAAQSELAQLQGEKETTQAELEKLQQSNAGLQQQNQQLTEQLTNAQQGDGEQDTAVSELQAQNEQLKQQLNSLEKDSDQANILQKQNEQLTQQLSNAEQGQTSVITELRTQNSQLTEQLDTVQQAKASADTENNQLQHQISLLKSNAPELQQQLEQLQASSEVLKAENATVNAELETVREQLSLSVQDAELLRDELVGLDERNTLLSKDLEEMNLKNADLQVELEVANEQNATLQTEIAQINASAANDVNLVKEPQPDFDWKSLWPWLLALLLLPVAWLLGRRSKPASVLPGANSAKIASSATAVADPSAMDLSAAAINDPVIPLAEPGTLDEITAASSVQSTPDTPDAALKLDMARAYLDLRNSEAANDMLREVMREGGTQQQQEAREILSFVG